MTAGPDRGRAACSPGRRFAKAIERGSRPEPAQLFFAVIVAQFDLQNTPVATHDATEAALADEVWRMEAGRVVEVTPGAVYRDQVGTRPGVPAWVRG